MLMRIKNEDFDFVRSAPSDVKMSFRGMPQKVHMPGGTKIFRFVTIGENATDSGFWISLRVFAYLAQWSANSGVPLSEIARSRFAVKLNWSSRIDTLCAATLRRPLYGFQGTTHYQSRLDSDPRFLKKGVGPQPNVLLMGGFEQLWIPDIALDDIWIDSYGPADNWKVSRAAGG
jgi:hypothetical protein